MIEPPQTAELERAARCVREHARPGPLAAFAYDVLGTQAEGGSLFAGQKFMAQRAEAHDVTRDSAATELGNLLAILERGPSDAAELALVGAFAFQGFANLFGAAEPELQTRLADKLVGQTAWLETATAYRLLACMTWLGDDAVHAAVCASLASAVLHEERAQADPALRARNAARLCALEQSSSPYACPQLERVRDQATDPASRALAASALGDVLPAASGTPPRVFGRARYASHRALPAVVRWLTGIAMLLWLGRMLGYLLASKRETELELAGRAVHVRTRTTLLGRTVSLREAHHDLSTLAYIERSARFGLFRSVVSVFSLSLGLLVGGHLIFDGARGGAPILLSLGALAVALGAGLDLALDVLGEGARARVTLQLGFQGARPLRVAQVPLVQADRFLEVVGTRLASRVRHTA